MSSKDIKIGKYTLETLTTGMYRDPLVIFREYIQNSTDAIDVAVRKDILGSIDDGEIKIGIDDFKKEICISDNGSGVPTDQAWERLTDVGNSIKEFDKNRGFRGIGRLAGLSYADELRFITTTIGEKSQAILSWDCIRLRELLKPGKHPEYDLAGVIREVAKITYESAPEAEHGFTVKLIGINGKQSKLFSLENVKMYLQQAAPIGFDAQLFPFYHDSPNGFKKKLKDVGKPLEEYQIFINDDPNPLYKPYSTRFKSGRGENVTLDKIQKIEYLKGEDEAGNLIFWGWYAVTGFFGQVKDPLVAGLRIRKGNILIGNGSTLNNWFTQSRFNAYFIGEIYVFDSDILPNGQRDDFERNEAYFQLREKLETYTRELSKFPHKYSILNNAIKKIDRGKTTLESIEEKIELGISSEKERDDLHKKRDTVIQEIEKSKKDLEKAKKKVTGSKIDDITKALEMAQDIQNKGENLENKIIDSDYLLDKEKALSGYSKDVKKVIISIFTVIDKELESSIAKFLQLKIVDELKAKKKKTKKR